MQIRLVILEGIRKDDEFIIKETITIGRSKTDLSLKDPKTSSEHAKITRLEGGRFELSDLNSLNGTFLNGQKLTSAQVLRRSDKILIGKTLIEVLDISADSDFEEGSWQHHIEQTLNKSLDYYEKIPPKQIGFKPFKQPLTLETLDGSLSFTFSYGPRDFSPSSFTYPYISGLDFELDVSPEGECILISQSEDLKINETLTKTKVLENLDRICIGQIELIVKF
ncbi:MAG: FHA domain-containing protein [Oligoflexia bacterium]|nr:FHA domain-containing protein [Oligoflexia bacterium]